MDSGGGLYHGHGRVPTAVAAIAQLDIVAEGAERERDTWSCKLDHDDN